MKIQGKEITMLQAMFIGLGNIIGAGIFVLAGTTIYIAGPGALLAFTVTAILAATVALNSAELSSKIVTHGGLYSFVKESMGDSMGFIVGWLRAISYAIAASAVALGFASYFISLVGISNSFIIFAAIVLIIITMLIDYKGIKIVARVEQYLVFITASGLVVFIILSLIYGSWNVNRFIPVVPHGFLSIIEAASLAFFAYSGFNTIATLTPEVKDGARNVPKAIVLSLVISTVMYILVVIGMLALMPWQYYRITGNPLQNSIDYAHIPSFFNVFIAVVAMIATITVTLSLLVAGSRTLLQMSEDGMFPKWIEGKGTDSPKRAVIIIGAVTVFSLFLGNLKYIALASNFGVIFSYALTGGAVIILRKRGIKGIFRSPGYPTVQILSIALSIVIMFSLGVQALYIGVVSIIAGIFVYTFIKMKNYETKLY